MARFKGIVKSLTLSTEDMQKLLTMPLDEIDKWSPVRVVILPDWKSVHRAIARSIVDTIKENNEKGKTTKLIFPVGPTEQYPVAAEISNTERISWRNVWTFNMDEYLDWEGRPIPEDHPHSFHASMKRNLFNLLNEELRPPEEQRWFPDPFDPDAIDDKIDELGGIDTAYGGIGEHGHIAFNEPVNTYFMRLTPEEFKRSKTRVVELNPDTLTRGLRSPLFEIPPRAVTLGMRVILEAKSIALVSFGPIFRIACMHPPTMDFPVTYVQEHPDPKNSVNLYTAREQWKV